MPQFTTSSWTNVVLRPLFLTCSVLGVLLLGGLVVVMALGASGSFGQPKGLSFSLWALAEMTFLTSTIALALAVPIGLSAALYLSEFASNRVHLWIEAPLRFLARVPPVVYGYFAVATVLPALDKLVPGLDKHPALSAGIALTGMIVPRFLEQSRLAIATVSQPVRDAACALGSSKFATTIFVVIPAVHRRLLAALLLAASRAVGETMIVLVVFTAYASKHASSPSTLTTFLVPNGSTTGSWGNQVPKEFFLVGCALLFLTLALDTVHVILDKPLRGDVR